MKTPSLAIALLALALPFRAAAAAFPDEAAIRREMRTFIDSHRGAPGVVVGILEPGRRLVVAEGRSGRRERQVIDGATRFEIGSITKTFTGVLLADMILSGEVTADQQVRALFPEGVPLANGVENATLEQLATHSSGLPRLALDLSTLTRLLSLDPYRGSTSGDVFRAVASAPGFQLGKPGKFAYSNLGLALLGRLLERRAREPYELLLRARVLEPLGLGGMGTVPEAPPSAELAVGHGESGRPAPYWHLDGYAPAGCLVASADEMLRFVELNLDRRHPALAEAQRPRLELRRGRAVGLAWMHDSIGGRHVVWHNGGTGGFRTYVGFVPEEGLGVVVLANGKGNADALARRLLDPKAPALPAHRPSAGGMATTLVLLAWGPLVLFGSARAAGAAGRLDRIDVLLRTLSPVIALLLAERLGAWLDLPFALWWGSLVLVLAGWAALAWRARGLPWWRAGVRANAFRALVATAEVAVLVVLLR